MRSKNLIISMVGAAFLTGALLMPAAASAHGRDRGYDRHDRYEHQHHHYKGKKRVRVIHEHRYEPYRRHHRYARPVVVYRDAPRVRVYPGNATSIIYRGGWRLSRPAGADGAAPLPGQGLC